MTVKFVEVLADDDDMRLDRWFKQKYPELSFGRLNKMLRKGQIRVNGGRVKGAVRVHEGEVIRVPPLKSMTKGVAAKKKNKTSYRISENDKKDFPKWILYEDKDILVVNKPHDLAVQGGSKLSRHLDGILSAYYDGTEKPKLVHRLDKHTSGILIVAKTATAARGLTQKFRERETKKDYLAILAGVPEQPMGEIRAALRKAGGAGNERMIIDEADGKRARSLYEILDNTGRKASLAALRPITGRTHQLRVHAALMENPILGDGKYGLVNHADVVFDAEEADFETAHTQKLCLHAWRMEFNHPRTGEKMRFIAPLPQHMKEVLALLGLFVPRDDVILFEDS